MFDINRNYADLQGSYLFSEIARRVAAFRAQHPDADIIKMGIGDVTRPLVPKVIEALHKAVDDMSRAETFHGYGPEQGYDFLIDKIIDYDYKRRGITIERDEVFVSDGSKCDVGNIQEIFSADSIVAVTDPVYPVYVDSNVMAGRAGAYNKTLGRYERIVYLPCTADNAFVPELPKGRVDMIYLCYPNNPTGMTLTKPQLKVWVDYALEHGAVLLFDSAYESYITDPDVPHSIYEIEGAKSVAIEFRSMSKTAGFTGTRCAYTVVPKQLECGDMKLNSMWNRRHTTKFNGVSYITQRGAEAIYTSEGREQINKTIAYYMENARIIRESVNAAGMQTFGGVNAPYIWLKTPQTNSWDFFDHLLSKLNIIGTPGAGFGRSGEGYFRLTAFSSREDTLRAMDRIKRDL
jgi:LL-diaminopimelate aminotransferase